MILKGLNQKPFASEFPASILSLDNGLTLIHQYLNFSPVAAVDVWVKAGAAREPESWSGIAHFLEHMIFKGTDRLPPGAFDRAIENRGGIANAATSYDYAHFFITTAAEYLENTLTPLAEILLRAAIPEDEFVRERDVVLEEIRQSEDDPDWLGFQSLLHAIYPRHPYGRSILGQLETLMEQSPEMMRRFHRCYYQPENMTVAIVGNIEQELALEMVTRQFRDFSPRLSCSPRTIEAEPPLIERRFQQLYLPRLETARLMMAWTGPGVERLHDAYGLDLLAVLLTEGRTSRLVRELREERHWVQSIDSNFSLGQDSSLFTIAAWLEPEYLEAVEALICDRLWELRSEPISESELLRCQRLLCNDYTFSTETATQLAGLYGYYHTIARADLAVSYPFHIQSFYPEDLQRVASAYLSPSHYAVTTLEPL